MAEPGVGLVEALGALARLLQPSPDTFDGLARLARQSVPGCDFASVSVLGSGDEVRTAGATDDRPIALDEAQYEVDEGPCLSAIRTGTRVLVDEFSGDARFPAFGPLAIAAGVASCLSVPVGSGDTTLGGLNLYATAAHAYDDVDTAALESVITAAATAVAGERAFDRSLKLVDQLHVAMASRAEIEQAKGILMARSHCDAEQAFDILRRASQRQNVKLRDIAHTIVVNTAAGLTGMTPEELS
jgi:GAF domain-containing protein